MIGLTISHYNILEKLGEGGMGVVYKAVDLKLDREVALKFLSSHFSDDTTAKARFIQEAKVVAALNHPNILSVYEIDEQDGNLFFVMEYVEGKTLKSFISDGKHGSGTDLKQAFDWTAQLAEALKSAHEKQVVHRDIKPENVMLTKDGKLKIMDFGIAQLKNSSGITREGTSMGTLSYMSPEQAKGIATDHRCDIWSLGVLLFELLTGDRPFRAEHDAGLLYLIMNENPPLPSEMDRKIPRQVDAFVMKMLEKDRAKRHADVNELLQALAEVRQSIEGAGSQPKTKAIAVLPFGNISPDKENDYFSDGLTEELIASLSKLKDIRLVPRATSMQYKGTSKDIQTIGRELGTRYILSGSVRKFQDNLRITVELIDVDSDAQLWAETYKGKLEDVFDIQEQVSKQIVEALMVKLTPKEQVVLSKRATLNTQAFDCNLRARDSLYRYTKTGIQTAIQLFQKAIDYDPRYADAYAGLSEAYANLYQRFERNDVLLDKALDAGLRALMYDPTLSEAYAALGLAYFHKKFHADALESSKKAIELDPTNSNAHWLLGRIHHTTDNDAEAVTSYEKAIEYEPDFYSAHMDLWLSYERLGDKERYKKALHNAVAMYPRYLALHPDDARAHIHFAITLARSGDMDESREQATIAIELSPNDPLILYNASCFYSNIGEKEKALASLRKAISAGYEFYEWIKRDTDLDSIRNDPEYIELMQGK